MESKEPRIFIFLRLRCGGEILVRSKIREFRALGSLLADMMGLVVKEDLHREADLTQAIFEYVDSNTGKVLLQLRSDDQGLLVSGSIPLEYQKRMLGTEQNQAINMAGFVKRAGRELDDADKQRLSHLATQRHHSLLEMIRAKIEGEDFKFRIRPATE
jgi:hypothetical protein